jgi:hypothetical protein
MGFAVQEAFQGLEATMLSLLNLNGQHWCVHSLSLFVTLLQLEFIYVIIQMLFHVSSLSGCGVLSEC